jgi:hypothetical protein
MSIKVMSAVWEIEGIDSSECLVLMALADHADERGRCYPSIGRLAKRTKLSDRGVQKVIARLIEKGFVTVTPSAGQGGANIYTVTATPELPAIVVADPVGARDIDAHLVNDVHPERGSPRTTGTTPPNDVRKTPERRSPKPSGTSIEPSEDIPARDPADILCEIATPKAVKSFLGYRRKIRKPVSEVAAERIAKTLTSIANQGGSPDDALGMAEEKGWQSIKAEWYFKEAQNDQSPQQNRQSAADDRFGRIADAAVRNRAPSRPDFGFG